MKVTVCIGSSCHVKGSRQVVEQLRQLIDEKIAMNATGASMSFKIAAKKYVAVKSNVLSPSTIRGYNILIRNMDEAFQELDIMDIRTYDVQKLINDYSADHAPKSVYNLNGFVVSVLRFFIPNVVIRTTLPQKPRKNDYTPSQGRLLQVRL